jgi:hypothetical protein
MRVDANFSIVPLVAGEHDLAPERIGLIEDDGSGGMRVHMEFPADMAYGLEDGSLQLVFTGAAEGELHFKVIPTSKASSH